MCSPPYSGSVSWCLPRAPQLALEYVMFHEMLHLRHPAEHALTAERPKAVYTVGRRAKIQGALHSVLPARTFDALVARAMKSG